MQEHYTIQIFITRINMLFDMLTHDVVTSEFSNFWLVTSVP